MVGWRRPHTGATHDAPTGVGADITVGATAAAAARRSTTTAATGRFSAGADTNSRWRRRPSERLLLAVGVKMFCMHTPPADGAAAFTALAATSRAAFASGADTVEDKVIDWLLLALRRRRRVPARSCGILLLRGGRRRSTAKEGGGAVWRVERVERALAIRPLWHRRGAWPPQRRRQRALQRAILRRPVRRQHCCHFYCVRALGRGGEELSLTSEKVPLVVAQTSLDLIPESVDSAEILDPCAK